MNGSLFFLDTNIVAYTFDKTAPEKQRVSQQLLEKALCNEGVISYQVVQEFINIALRKFNPPMTERQAKRYLQTVLLQICGYYPADIFFERGLDIYKRWRFGWYDSLIIAAALELNCDVLYSEDLQHKQEIETLTVINPFAQID